MDYVVGIPTKDRDEMLSKCLRAFADSTIPPIKVLLINNNLPLRDLKLNIPKDVPYEIVCLNNPSMIKGCAQGAKVALDWMIEHDIKVGVKWDDDLIPNPDCMEHLSNWIDKYEAVGGCYPPSTETRLWEGGPCSGNPLPDGINTHLQFFKWYSNNVPNPVEVGALYSSYMFQVDAMKNSGNWNGVKRSPIGYREDTEVTMKLNSRLIEPKAIAIHNVISGGGRSFPQPILQEMTRHDAIQLNKVLRNKNISFEDLFKVKEISR